VRASFSSRQEELQSIPISSFGFRWHVDLAGPFPISKQGSRNIMVAVEAFSKFLVVVPIPSKEPAVVAQALLHHVLAKFAAPGQIVTDNGTEFTTGAFAQLLADSLIDHCTTSVAHPRANGQAERAVQTVKTALRAMCLQRERLDDWDSDVAQLALAYNCSTSSSSGFKPYELMFARPAHVPPAAAGTMQPAIDYEDPAAAAADLMSRKEMLQRHVPAAMNNLAIAQHRDQRRYAVVRSGKYQPRVYRFQVGDFVYVQQQQQHSTLQPKAMPQVVRVVEVRPSGRLVVEGMCGSQAEVRSEHCAPCHLPHLQGAVDPVLAFDPSTVCEVCSREKPKALLLLCDNCNRGIHTVCLQPPLDAVPAGDWLCPACLQDGVTLADVAAKQQQREEVQQRASLPNLYPDARTKRQDQQAEALHGRLIRKPFRDADGSQRQFWGRLHYRGPLSRPNYYLAVYEDGDSETLRFATARDLLATADQQLPAGVTIPELSPQQSVAVHGSGRFCGAASSSSSSCSA